MSDQPDVSIIIVNWNVQDYLDACLRTIHEHTRGVTYEVIVVDNASADHSVDMVREKYPWVKLIASTENLGFTRGNNRGLAEATGRHILYLNPDIELIEDAISPLVVYLDRHPEVGAVGCHLLFGDRTHQNSIARFLRLSGMWREYVLREKHQRVVQAHPQVPTVVEAVLGACLLVRGEAVREIGGFDERYFMYQEETDLCLALRKRGLQTVYFPEVAMVHHLSKTSTKSEETRQRTLHENRRSQYLFLRKNYGYWPALAGKFLLTLALGSRLLFFLGLRLLAPSRGHRLRYKITYYRKTLSWLWFGW
jgi:GT2 family glycosyltransferase